MITIEEYNRRQKILHEAEVVKVLNAQDEAMRLEQINARPEPTGVACPCGKEFEMSKYKVSDTAVELRCECGNTAVITKAVFGAMQITIQKA